MHYLIALKGGRFLAEEDGKVKIVEVQLPYPDCEYKGVRGSENIFERLGLSYTSSGRKEDAIKKVLAGRDEMSIKTFITEAKRFTEKNNKYKEYIYKKQQAEEYKAEIERKKQYRKRERDFVFDTLESYLGSTCADILKSSFSNLGLKYMSDEKDVYFMFQITDEDLTFEQLHYIDKVLNTLPIKEKGVFKIYKDVMSSIEGRFPCVILYDLRENFDTDNLLLNPCFGDTIYALNYSWENIDTATEKVLCGTKITYSFNEEHEEYGEYDSNIVLQYTEFKRR